MNKQDTMQPNTSVAAVRQYIQSNKSFGERHKVHIIASINNRNHFGILTVFASATENYASVIIENLSDICNTHTNCFTSERCEFSIINKTLIIKEYRTPVGAIHIEITPEQMQ